MIIIIRNFPNINIQEKVSVLSKLYKKFDIRNPNKFFYKLTESEIMKILKRELGIYALIFVVLALIMHYKEWFSHPIKHLEALSHSELGLFHPIYLSFLVYLLIGVVRLAIMGVGKLIKR